MVDFSFTAADEQVLATFRNECAIGRKHAREQDRTRELVRPALCETHPDVAALEPPFAVLERLEPETSGGVLMGAIMRMASSVDAEVREDPHEPFGNMVIEQWGTPEQLQLYGGKRFAIALTEPGAGSDPLAMRTNARLDPATGEWILNGEKIYISFFNKFDGAVVMAKENPDERGMGRITAFVLPRTTPGVSEGSQFRKMGIHKHDVTSFSMDDVRLPAVARLDADIAKVLSKFNHNRPLVAAVALGACRCMLDFTHEVLGREGVAVDYLAPVQSRTALQDRLIALEAEWEAAWGTVARAKWLEQEGEPYLTAASVAKAFGGRAVRTITQECLKILGSQGISEDYLAEKWLRDVRIADIYEGAGEVQRILIARDILGYRREIN